MKKNKSNSINKKLTSTGNKKKETLSKKTFERSKKSKELSKEGVVEKKNKPFSPKNNIKTEIKKNKLNKSTGNNLNKHKTFNSHTLNSKNLNKSQNKINKKEEVKPEKKNSQKKNNILSTRDKSKLKIDTDKITSLLPLSKNNETISTNFNTASTEKNLSTLNKEENRRQSKLNKKNISTKKDKNNTKNNEKKTELKNTEIDIKPNDDTGDINKVDTKKNLLTPIPMLQKKKGEQVDVLSKDVQNAIMLRRQEYNDYIKSLNKPKVKKPKPIKPKPKPKEKVYDENKVIYIQKIFKGFSTRNVNQVINRLKSNLCCVELFCLLLSDDFNLAAKRLSFNLIKLYYFDPFDKIDNEINFNDRISMKLSNKFYNFNELTLEKK